MAAESIITHLRENFPKKGLASGNYKTELEYIGEYAALQAAAPAIGSPWGDYEGVVDSVNIEPISGTTPLRGTLSISMVEEFSGAESSGTEKAASVIRQIVWTPVSRPLIEHPEFQWGGSCYLDPSELADLAIWEQDKTHVVAGTNPNKYITGRNMGIETYDDYAPTLTKTTPFVNGVSPTSVAGAKDEPTGFDNKPTGYEWVKTADDCVSTGRRNRWERVEQWTGDKKILVDKNTLYYLELE
jgi:hypothetical protein